MIARRVLVAMMLVLPVAAQAQAPRGAPPPPLALPPGMSPLPHGAWRVAFRGADATLAPATEATLREIGRRLAATEAGRGRITVEGQASGPANDASAARRVALARANAVRAALVAGGLEETRVDVRPLGRTSAALDAADVLPPDAPRSGQTR
jgi:hypothetical protein